MSTYQLRRAIPVFPGITDNGTLTGEPQILALGMTVNIVRVERWKGALVTFNNGFIDLYGWVSGDDLDLE